MASTNIPTRYNALAAYVSVLSATGAATGSFQPQELTRVQDFSSDLTNNNIDVNAFGQLARIGVLSDSPDVSLQLSWYATNLKNEASAGLTIATGNNPLTSIISGLLAGNTDEKNIWVSVALPQYDANGNINTYTGAIGFGNCFLSNYTLNGAVDGLLTSSVTFNCLNAKFYTGLQGTETVPAITSSGTQVNQVFVLPPYSNNTSADQPLAITDYGMILNVSGDLGFTYSDLKIQNFSLSVDLSREVYNKLGNRYPYARPITFPAPYTLSVDAQVGEMTSGNLADLLCQSGNISGSLLFYPPSCPTSPAAVPACAFYFRGAKLNTQNNAASISDPLSLSFELGGQLAGVGDTNNGIMASGSFTS